MIKDTIRRHIRNRRMNWTLLFFIASLLAFSITSPQLATKNNAVTIAKAEHGTENLKTEREEGFELRARGFLDTERHLEDALLIASEKAKGSIVAVDAGHGGIDCGTGYDGVEEKEVNLAISLKLGEMLNKAGIRVVYTREKDEYIGLNKRAKIANEAGADLFISIHCNGMEDDTSCNGSETLYKKKKSETGKVNSKRFAEIVQGEMFGAIGTKDNGIINRPRLAVLVLAKMPAVIAEVGYVSNSSDREKLKSEEYRNKAAEALCKATLKTLDEMK